MMTSANPPKMPPKSAPIFIPEFPLSPAVPAVLVSVTPDAVVIAVIVILLLEVPLELAASVPFVMYR
jgi:hypothetical protein